MQVTINVPKNVINNIKRSAEIYGGVTPTDAQIQEFLQWHVLGITPTSTAKTWNT